MNILNRHLLQLGGANHTGIVDQIQDVPFTDPVTNRLPGLLGVRKINRLERLSLKKRRWCGSTEMQDIKTIVDHSPDDSPTNASAAPGNQNRSFGCPVHPYCALMPLSLISLLHLARSASSNLAKSAPNKVPGVAATLGYASLILSDCKPTRAASMSLLTTG